MDAADIAGGALVVYAAFMAGRTVGLMHTRMVKELEEILQFIRMVKAQIAYAGDELPQIIESCGAKLHGAVGNWLGSVAVMMAEQPEQTFAGVWHRSLAALETESCLKRDMLDELDRLGGILGDMDVDSQISQITLVERTIDDGYRRESGRTAGVLRLSSSLGMLGGLFLVILLI